MLSSKFAGANPLNRLSLLAISAVIVMTVSCGSVSPVSDRAGDSLSIWDRSGTMLPAGDRTALSADGFGWILTHETVSGLLVLAKVSLLTGDVIGTYRIDPGAPSYSGAGLTADGLGHLWITYENQIVELDESTGTLHVWTIPAFGLEVPTNAQLAGNAQGNAWISGQLFFVRNEDERVYSFDPRTGIFHVVAVLPITTSYISSIASGHGELAVSGSLTASTAFVPATATLAISTGSVTLRMGSAAVCGKPSGLTFIDSEGVVTRDDGALIGALHSHNDTHFPFTCDSRDDVFQATFDSGSVVVSRLTDTGQGRAVTGALKPIVVRGLAGPVNTYADPNIQQVLPDEAGGVWLVSALGATPSSTASPMYPSLAHVIFPA